MTFREADLQHTHPLHVKCGQPKLDLPIDKIVVLHKKGYGSRRIVRELAKMGIEVSKDTINRRIAELGV